MYFLKSKEFGNFVKSLHNCKELCKLNYINLHAGRRMSGGGDTRSSRTFRGTDISRQYEFNLH